MSRQNVGIFDFKKLKAAGIDILTFMRSADYCASAEAGSDSWKEFLSSNGTPLQSKLPLGIVLSKVSAMQSPKEKSPDFSHYHRWNDEDEKLNYLMERQEAREKLLETQKKMLQEQLDKEQNSRTLKLVF